MVYFSRVLLYDKIDVSMGDDHDFILESSCPKGLGLFIFVLLRPVECRAYSSGVSEKK